MRIAACFLSLTLLAPGTAARSADRPLQHDVSLTCGDGLFRLESEVLPGRQAPLAPIRQRLTFKVGANGRLVPLQRLGLVSVDGQEVQLAYVSSWACVGAKDGRSYLDLEYDCAVDPGSKNACPAGKEWFRLVDPRGRVLGGDRPDEAADAKLQARLGLSDALAAGVSMQDVLVDAP